MPKTNASTSNKKKTVDPSKQAKFEFFVMDIEHDHRGYCPWHWIEARPILAYSVLDTPGSLAADWKPLNAKLEREKSAPDIYGFSGRFVLNEKAFHVLRPFLGVDAEALALSLPKKAKEVGPLVVLHLLGGEIKNGCDDIFADANDFIFRKKDVNGRHFFNSGIFTFVSATVQQAIENAKLQGVSIRTANYRMRN